MKQNGISRRTWLTLITVWVCMAGSHTITFSYGMMLPDVMREFSMDYATAGLIGSLSGIASVVLTIPVALIASRFNPKYTLPICSGMMALGMLLFGRAANIAMLFAGRIVTASFASGITTCLVGVKMKKVPQNRISDVNGIENFMQPVGQTLATLCMTQILMLLKGWRNVYTLIGIVLLVMTVAWLLLYRQDTPAAAHVSSRSNGNQSLQIALKQKPFWLVFLAMPWTVLIWIGIFYYWPSYAQASLGLTAAQSGLVVSFIPIFSAVASLTGPKLAQKLGYDKPLIWPWGFVLPVLYFLMLRTQNLAVLCLFSALAGYGAYCYVPLVFTTLYKLGLAPNVVAIGTAMTMTGISLGTAMGSGIIGWLITAFGGDIQKALTVCCLSPVIFGVLMLFIPERGSKAAGRIPKK